jgi:glucosyl-3-phosphoglycerate synthase
MSAARRVQFRPIRTALVPVLPEKDISAAIAAARAIAQHVRLLGVVYVPPDRSLSAGAERARKVRARMRHLAADPHMSRVAEVLVSSDPWPDLVRFIAGQPPDLLVLDWGAHFDYLAISPGDVLLAPPCNVALVRGPFPDEVQEVLLPLRGGPHAELVLSTGIALAPPRLSTLHLRPPTLPSGGDAPFIGLQQVLRQMPEIGSKTVVTDDPAGAILAEARDYDLIIMGATAQPLDQPTTLGPVADAIIHHADAAVIVVKNKRAMPWPQADEAAGVQAISILVDRWFAENTFHADEFANLRELVAAKHAQGLTVSLALPALNEEETIGPIISAVKQALMERVPLLDELVVIDSASTDRTREIAAELGAAVFIHQELLPEYGARSGKGEALWKSLHVTRGDIVAWIDTDIVNFHPRFVYGIVGPLITNRRVQLVKGFYRRPLRVGDKVQASGGGRVTELMARPLINLFYPELSGILQPLSGEYAGRRTALEQAVFFSGYGVETGLLLDVFERYGLAAIAQVDLLERIHKNQSLEALSKMAFVILQVIVQRLEGRIGHPLLQEVNRTMKLARYTRGGYYLDVEEVAELDRPPMISLPEYLALRQKEPA